MECSSQQPALQAAHVPLNAHPECDPRARCENLRDLLEHLHAQLALISGGGFDSFDELNERIKDSLVTGMTNQAAQAIAECEMLSRFVYGVH